MSQTINALMQAKRTAHIDVCPTLELKNVANRRLTELREKKKIQRVLLDTLHYTAVNTNSMQFDTDIRMDADIRIDTDIRMDADIRIDTDIRIDADKRTISFNEHVSEIISLQDTILLDYVRVCNIRLRSHTTPTPSPYTQDAAAYMCILTALITA
jgi:hypothetical protein